MKKLLLILLIALMASGCATAEADKSIPSEYLGRLESNGFTMEIYKFKDAGTDCYVAIGYNKGGISCIKNQP